MATSGSRPVPFLAEPAASRLGYEDLNKYHKISNLMSTKKKCPTKQALWFLLCGSNGKKNRHINFEGFS